MRHITLFLSLICTKAKIHASLARCDPLIDTFTLSCFMLKSTHPLRDATISPISQSISPGVLKSTHPLRDATAKYSARLCKKTTFRVSIFYFLIQTYEMNKKRAIFHLFWCESFREILSTWDSHDSLVINFPVRCIYCTGQRLWCQMDLRFPPDSSRFIPSWKALAGSNPICLKAGVGSLITTVIICLPRTEAWTVKSINSGRVPRP